jgi:tetratricopeptide (TPR) repeat protein
MNQEGPFRWEIRRIANVSGPLGVIAIKFSDEELLKAMRLAGCQRLSLGVESGSSAVLHNIRKQVTPETIAAATQLAKRYGLQVRYFMMLGNRGETAETFRQSLAFVAAARPHQSIFACLSVYPGTRDFEELERAGVLDREAYFTEDFQELKTPFDASAEDTALMSDWFSRHSGIQTHFEEGVAEYRAILERLGEHPAAHVDLGGAYYRSGQYDLAEQHLQQALQLGYPLPELVHNYLACIAAQCGDLQRLQQELARALQGPPHPVLVQNLQTVSAWRARGGKVQQLASRLAAHHDFQLLEPTVQPLLPGPLPEDFTQWRASRNS